MTDSSAPNSSSRRWTLRRTLDVLLVLALAITALRIFIEWSPNSAGSSQTTSLTPTITIGDTLRFPDVRWSATRSVVLVLSTTCPACNANLPFYRQLAAVVPADTLLMALSAEPLDVLSDWLRTNDVQIRRVHRLDSPTSHGFTLTPMIVIVDRDGRVTDIMIRRLDEGDQARVLARIRDLATASLDNSQQIREISVVDLTSPALTPPLILDVRPREEFRLGHRPDARNIPLGELRARAPIELQSTDRVVLDCLQPGAAMCRGAAWTLVDEGFTNVSILIR